MTEKFLFFNYTLKCLVCFFLEVNSQNKGYFLWINENFMFYNYRTVWAMNYKNLFCDFTYLLCSFTDPTHLSLLYMFCIMSVTSLVYRLNVFPFQPSYLSGQMKILQESSLHKSIFLLTQTYNGPRCDLHKNIIVHGCQAASIITVKSSQAILKVSPDHSSTSLASD